METKVVYSSGKVRWLSPGDQIAGRFIGISNNQIKLQDAGGDTFAIDLSSPNEIDWWGDIAERGGLIVIKYLGQKMDLENLVCVTEFEVH